MKGFYIIFQMFILLILILNGVLFILFGQEFININLTSKYIILSLLIISEFILIMIYIQKIFYDPILNLEITIKKFYTGDYKNKNVVFKKSANKNVDYILNFFSKTLNTLRNIKDEFIHGKAIKGEVELGKEIQGKMLEKKLLEIPSIDIIMKSKPAGEIGGDSYDIINQDDLYYIYVGDATGHGVGAGFIMIMVNALISGFAKIYKSGDIILTKTNEVLKPRVKANLLMSLLLVRWDEKSKRIFMTGAGHEYLMIFKYKENKTYKIKSGGIALGMIKDVSKILKEKEIKFEKNDIIVMYSDGITEAINRPMKDGQETMFGETRLMDAITGAPSGKDNIKSANSVFNNISIELSKFMGYKHCQLDDVTLAVLHYKGDEENNQDEYKEIPKDFITEWSWEKN